MSSPLKAAASVLPKLAAAIQPRSSISASPHRPFSGLTVSTALEPAHREQRLSWKGLAKSLAVAETVGQTIAKLGAFSKETSVLNVSGSIVPWAQHLPCSGMDEGPLGASKKQYDFVVSLELPHSFNQDYVRPRADALRLGSPGAVCAEMASMAKRGIAVANVCLLREPTREEHAKVQELERLWAAAVPESKLNGEAGKPAGKIHPLAQWEAALAKVGETGIDKNGASAIDVLRLQHEKDVILGSGKPAAKAAALACELADCGLLGYFSAVARLR